jgi:hypothetical protein
VPDAIARRLWRWRRWNPLPSLEDSRAGANGAVSWLEASFAGLPTRVSIGQWLNGEPVRIVAPGLLQWRGRAGFSPASSSAVRVLRARR